MTTKSTIRENKQAVRVIVTFGALFSGLCALSFNPESLHPEESDIASGEVEDPPQIEVRYSAFSEEMDLIMDQPVEKFIPALTPYPFPLKNTSGHPTTRRWKLGTPPASKAEIWNIPEEETLQTQATALLRMCISEADGNRADCIGIWQVVQNVRSRSCDRSLRARITECNDSGEETILSAMKRLSGAVLGLIPTRSRRQRWISELELACSMPKSFPHGPDVWRRHYQSRCPRASKLARDLVSGALHKKITPAPIIAWGGRCEVSRGACDDRIACLRRLARVPGLHTKNAFWCRPGSPNCASDVDPLCRQYLDRAH
jgi:hypothetical protein